MIGQKENIEKLKTMKTNNSLPRLIIISGKSMTGKGTLMKEFSYIIDENADVLSMAPDVESMRQIISNKVEKTTVYLIDKFDRMSLAGQNSVLKIFEEPPKFCYFIISTDDEELMLQTIMSRGVIFRMEPYSKNELLAYYNDEKLVEFCKTPSELDYWKDRDITKFEKFIKSYFKVLTTGTITDCLIEIKDKLSYDNKGEEPYYEYFYRAINTMIYKNKIIKNPIYLKKYLELSNKTQRYMRRNGIRQNFLLETYIIKTNKLIRG